MRKLLPPSLGAVVSVLACSSDPKKPPVLPTQEQVFEPTGAKCDAFRAPTEPDLIGWDSNSRGKLNSQRSFGVIVVRYVAKGCNVELEVLTNCIARTHKYSYQPYWSNESKHAQNQEELFANLPIGAASLQGHIKDGESLRADLTSAGIASIPPDATFTMSDLKGVDCPRATHVVSKVYLGAFAMAAGASRELRAAATVFGVGGGAGKGAVHAIGREEGDLGACKSAKQEHKENPDCAVPLRLSLLSVDGASPGGSPAPGKGPDPLAPPPRGTDRALAGAWELDGLAPGKDASLVAKPPFNTPCDSGKTDENTRLHFLAGKECREKMFPDGTSVVVFTDPFDASNRYAGKISAIGWFGGKYFDGKTTFPLKSGEAAERAIQVLGPVEAAIGIGGSRGDLVAQKHAKVWSVIHGAKIAGFVLGTMPSGYTRDGSWNVVQQLYFKYGEKVSAPPERDKPPPSPN